jgi:hypothetical protein
MRTKRGARELCRGVGGIELARLKSGSPAARAHLLRATFERRRRISR